MKGRIAARLDATPTPAGTELRLLVGGKPIPASGWALSGHPGAALCQRLLTEGEADEGDDLLVVEHAAVSRLTAAEAARLDLPPATPLRAVVEGSGIMVRPDFRVSLRWTRPGGQNVLGVQRVGAWLREADGPRRLPETLFVVAEAVEAHAAATDEAARLRALARLREALPHAATAGAADGCGMLGTATIVEADAFSLEASGEGDALQLRPVLHRAGDDGAPLLADDRLRASADGQFLGFPAARAVYTLPGGVYLVLSPPLREALQVVRRACAGSPAQRRALLREPRAAIRAVIGDEADEAVLERLVVETPAWSERVIGLGLWQKRVLPWIDLPGNDWFGPPDRAPPGPGVRGLQVGDRRLTLRQEQADDLAAQVQAAIERGAPNVTVATPEGPLDVPAAQATLDALAALRPSAANEGKPAAQAETLVIEPNEDGLTAEALTRPRAGAAPGLPACLRSTLKEHQREGLAWLQQSWAAGAPGVLLADDMGLGKTLQGLAFLAWLREAMAAGLVPRAPVLIVAPTGLLENWRAEHDRHLQAPGLGTPLLAFGKGLAALRHSAAASLDRDAIRSADWVLTTYETLRDQLTDFGEVRFAAMLMDEAQKAKTPGIRLTDAVKAMNADFRVALTGTPVENRLSDLWCIVDCTWAGHLRDLRWFSDRFERDMDVDRLKELKTYLDEPGGNRPPMLLRRLKEDRLPGLPPREDVLLRGEMTGRQLAAYEEAVELGRQDGGGPVLTALHRLRSASLHGGIRDEDDDAAAIAASVRLRLTLAVLDRVAAKRERALVFVDDLGFMARLAGLLQRRYRLENAPMTISGKVAGGARQSRVDRFQTAPAGFDVMLLSPKAGGVGLTLTRASHAVHLSRWWNPATEDQCSGRIHRIGQERPVNIYVPLAILPDGRASFDENLHALLERKRRLTRDALMPPEPGGEELADMLRASVG